MLLPMQETTFDSQYKTFKALGGFGKQRGALEQMEFNKDLASKIGRRDQGMPFVRRQFQKPVFAEEAFPVHSVFQSNAKSMLVSP